MDFNKIPPVETSKHFLDLAFRKAREKGKAKKLVGNWLQIIRKKESLKLDIIKDNLVVKLQKVLDSFPQTKDLGVFYIKLMELTIDYGNYQKSLSILEWSIKRIQFFQRDYVGKINRCKERGKISGLSNEFYGRVSSVMKNVGKHLKYLEQARKVMRTYPAVKEMFTVCLYGFPNVGKTTLLNKLTGTTAEVAAYSFTTKTINSGYFKVDGKKIQVLDVPGTLARDEKMNNIERQADLVRRELADLIVYVFDLSELSSYSIRNQEQLFRKLGKKQKVFVYFSKLDLIDDDLSKYIKKYRPLDALGLKKKIEMLVN
ncbi:MAG: 50S ribosome-binding GTPase [Nanoarchaeota archaeon]|nr:50S ribosome-binding GTPase [Nanoarchaeota archaeon]MBU1622120.1 50S ribosome-binding GTPase [Nanoarchaeota archaeon]